MLGASEVFLCRHARQFRENRSNPMMHPNVLTNTLLLSLLIVLMLWRSPLYSNSLDTIPKDTKLHITGFIDVFYVYDVNKPVTSQRQSFLFNHNRHNEFNLNLALVNFAWNADRYRANLALQVGTYAQDNYAAEQGLLKNIFEAYVGLALNKRSNLWVDVGIFSSHLGFESAISMDNMTLTRSLVAENSPYYLSGAKLSYQASEKWKALFIVSNGWQRIQRVQGNSLLSLGAQLVFSPNDRWSLNWSTFYGTDDPDNQRRMRWFNNFYVQGELTDRWRVLGGIDVGIQESLTSQNKTDRWSGLTFISQYQWSKRWSSSVRYEHYQDPNAVIISSQNNVYFKASGISFNLDYVPQANVIWRIECRNMHNPNGQYFELMSGNSQNNLILASAISMKF